MPYPRQRKFPRIPFNRDGSLEYRDPKRGRVQVPATVNSVACEGVGLTIHQAAELKRRAKVSVTLTVNDGELTLPGVVVWHRQSAVGVHLLLELALPKVRQQWAQWIVDQTNQFRMRQRRRTSP